MFKTICIACLLFFIVNKTTAQPIANNDTTVKVSLIKILHSSSFNLQLPALPAHFYNEKLPLFCSMEWKLEKTTKIPFRFRLGSVEYCDKMDGKNR